MKEFIDLDLPSGNLWATENEEGYYTFKEAVDQFGCSLPTKEDFDELVKHCWHRWNDVNKGLEFMGDNGEKLFLPAKGWCFNGIVDEDSISGDYMTQTKTSNLEEVDFIFDADLIRLLDTYDDTSRTVRLIQRNENN